MNQENDWNPSIASIACIVVTLSWLIAAAIYQTAQSLAWLWQLVTGGAE